MRLSADTNPILPIWRDEIKAPQSPDLHQDETEPLLGKAIPIDPSEMGEKQRLRQESISLALALPWVASMLTSWIPLSKVGLSKAPIFLQLAGMASALEVLSIVAVFLYTSRSSNAFASEPTEPGRPKEWQEKAFRAWFWFLFVSPLATSGLVVFMASDIACDYDDLAMHIPICRIGIRLIKATALCRGLIVAIFLFATSSWLRSREATHKSESSATRPLEKSIVR
ncbi:hypothetical protein FZEAL_9365 [Fusarium zealandicum]|uniref:Uncharacterized protein n=1 Tax=Fusarium zealandicum TaxID=1053134 RepID=A0A8H4UBB6_9HYPO|nr:hypothetical protein FZEAL_9365 [Fusarium zealandicum]